LPTTFAKLEMPLNKDLRAIRFNYLVDFSFSNRTATKMIILRILKDAGLKAKAINFIFCSDDYLLKINREHLNHDYYTDIITFDLSEVRGEITADIYISVDRVVENARTFNRPRLEELRRVIFHGVLHLTGLRDKSNGEQETMRMAEEKYLKLYEKQADVPRITVSRRNIK